MAKNKVVYFCTECGNETPKWQGKCPACGAWNSLQEHIEKPMPSFSRGVSSPTSPSRAPQRINNIKSDKESRFFTGLEELDRAVNKLRQGLALELTSCQKGNVDELVEFVGVDSIGCVLLLELLLESS